MYANYRQMPNPYQNFGQIPQPQQIYTPPTIHAEIIQVGSEQEAENFGVGTGCTQMMCAKDDSAFFVKTVYANGQTEFTVYEKRIPKPVPKPDFVTRAELEQAIANLRKENSYGINIRQAESTAEQTDGYCYPVSTVSAESDTVSDAIRT